MVDSKNLQSVSDYLQQHKDKIITTYHAQGVGIGKVKLSDEDYVIVVYLDNEQQVPKDAVVLDNIRLKFEVTGQFTIHKK